MDGSKVTSTYEKQLIALGRALQKVREAGHAETIIQTVLQYLQTEFDYTLAWLGLYQADSHILVGQGGFTPTGDEGVLSQTFGLEPGELLEQVVVQKRLIGVPDLQDVPQGGQWQRIAHQLNVKGAILFPIRHCDECLGVALLGTAVWGIPAESEEKARLSMILGELGTALSRLESDRQQQQSQQPITALLSILHQVQSLTTVEDQLAVVIRESHQFLRGDRTHLYWFSPTHRAFWRWIGQPGDKRQLEPQDLLDEWPPSQSSPGMAAIRRNQQILPSIPVEAIAAFRQQLESSPLIAVSEADSLLQANTASLVMEQMGAQSLLAVPILMQSELWGFIAVTGQHPRLWTDAEKQYLKGAGQLAALMAPLLEPEQVIAEIRRDQALAAEICQAICGQEDWNNALTACAQDIQDRFRAQRFFVLSYNESRATFSVVYQNQPPGRQKRLHDSFPSLSDTDWSLLERCQTAIAIEDIAHDLKLMDWHPPLTEANIRSFLVCPVNLGNPGHGLVVVAHEAPHHWTVQEQTISQVISQQIGVLLRQWHLNNELEQRQSIHQAIHGSLSTIQKTHHLGKMETASMRRVMDLMDVPLVALVQWEPEQSYTKISEHLVVSQNDGFFLNTDCTISIETDALIQWSLRSDDILTLPVNYLTTETRTWLNGPSIGQVLAVALRTDPEHQALGLLLVADVAERFWSNYQIEVLEVVGRQLAWSRRYLMLTNKLTTRQQELEQLNWYKHRSLENLCWTLSSDIKRLTHLNGTDPPSDSSDPISGGSTDTVRVQQLLRHMGQLLIDIRPMVREEEWQLQQINTSAPLVSLLKRAIARVDPLIQKRQLWAKVHNEQNVAIIGDIAKTELVLHEILAEACRRAPKQSGLDIWCRALDFNWIELSITDHGSIDAQLLEELHHGRPTDWLATSTLDTPPGLHFAICQAIIQTIGGEFNVYALEDGRILSQMTLRIDRRDMDR